ncbi:hypothetical protein STAS_12223 [Striga asiatica]|uniref:Uncharacterized protein n=1 Tax=Striga asiatica TaxID=4170 RepID=A0A5A7PTH8_STRAF|nr:hypothetical protein STAS_12223 [Striga asiatica]
MRSIVRSQTRSSSMPSRSYPLTITPEFDLHLHTLNSENEPTSSSSSSSSLSSIAKKLHNLESLYDCVDNLLLLPHTNQIFTRESREKWVDEILDGYLGLVDTCATAKDFLTQSKEHISNLLSVLRRKRGSEDLSEFITSRKTIKKQIQKSLTSIGSYKKNSSVLKTGDKDQEIIAIIRTFKEIERTTFELFEALLSSVSGETSDSKPSKWSLVSKLIGSRKISCHEHKSSMLEFGDLDASLSKGSKIEDSQQQLREMELAIIVLEEKLECLFKHLIKSRVTLLNMQSQL